jgi:hypothetical protein
VKRGLEERRKLDQMHEKKMEELSKQHDEMKKALVGKIMA